MTGDVARRPAFQAITHHRNPAARKGNVRDAVDALRGIDDSAAAQNKVMNGHSTNSSDRVDEEGSGNTLASIAQGAIGVAVAEIHKGIFDASHSFLSFERTAIGH